LRGHGERSSSDRPTHRLVWAHTRLFPFASSGGVGGQRNDSSGGLLPAACLVDVSSGCDKATGVRSPTRAHLTLRFILTSGSNLMLSLVVAAANIFGVNPGDITVMLQRIERGEEQAADRLLPIVYDELRRLAAARMAHEAPGTLQPTALVHEAWIRLGADRQPDWKSRAQFFAAAAKDMQRILIDRARHRLSQRRGGRIEHVNIDDLEVAGASDDAGVLKVDEALEKFALVEPRKAELVRLRYFVGFTLEEAASALNIAEPTARRWWAYSRAWLLNEMAARGT
jgi:RNA polymerase sigma factor (TIGR02999 family)